MKKAKTDSYTKKAIAHLLRSYCKNTPIDKGKYRIQLLAQQYLKFDEKLPYEYFGAKYSLDLNTSLGARLFYFGDYESEDIKKCLQMLKPGSVFFDIGANIGFYSLSAANQGATVYAFEPNPEAFADLKHNMGFNPELNIQAFNLACSDREGEIDFTLATDSAYSSMHDTAYDWQTWKIQKSQQITVPSKQIDTLVDELNIEVIDYCKIDVEGGELNVLRGALKTLSQQRVKVFQIEIDNATYRGAGYQTQDLIKLLETYGYYTDSQSLQIINNPKSSGNFFFVHN